MFVASVALGFIALAAGTNGDVDALTNDAFRLADEGRYCDALGRFLALNERSPSARMTFNAAEVALAANDLSRAETLYASLAREHPEFEHAAVVDERLAKIARLRAAGDVGVSCAWDPFDMPPPPAPPPEPVPPAVEDVTTPPPAAPAPAPPPPPATPVERGGGSALAYGVGGGAVAVGALMCTLGLVPVAQHAAARAELERIEARIAPGDVDGARALLAEGAPYRAAQDEARRNWEQLGAPAAIGGAVVVVAGAVVVVGGATWWAE